eukprot:m.25173 g.25173  ORF g.25173 m.25173 type:complete len:367 (-) comp9181_c0_seq1:100-1200(-)
MLRFDRTQPADHCETPASAYKDIAPLLTQIATLLCKPPQELTIYDPYFCAGSMKSHLMRVGFPDVINECRDFYADIYNKTIPEYDVLITNPPYSTDNYNHIKRLMQFCVDMKKPFLILQPVYVYTKEYYKEASRQLGTGCFFLTPSQRYLYKTPEGFRNVKANQLTTSPFVSLWYGFVPEEMFVDVCDWWTREGYDECGGCVFRAKSHRLPQRFKDSHDPTRRRQWLKQRRTKQRRALQSQTTTKQSGGGKDKKTNPTRKQQGLMKKRQKKNKNKMITQLQAREKGDEQEKKKEEEKMNSEGGVDNDDEDILSCKRSKRDKGEMKSQQQQEANAVIKKETKEKTKKRKKKDKVKDKAQKKEKRKKK